jgi:reverse gyrase
MKNCLAALVFAIAGCANTAQELRDDPSAKIAFDIERNYQPVYRAILERARRCFQFGMITAQMVVQGDLYHDIKSGNVTIALHGGLGVATYVTTDIKAISDTQTRVETFVLLSGYLSTARAVEEWAHERSTECSAPAKP